MTTQTEGVKADWVACFDDTDEAWAVRSIDGGLLVANLEASDYTLQSDADHARLIAAAPDLLEALKEMVEFRDAEIDPGDSTWAKVDAAIAKALGQ